MKFEFPNGITVNIRPIVRNTINHNKPREPDLNSEACITCQNYGKYKACLVGSEPDCEFSCDFYKRKRSGAYRRKRAKYNERRKRQ